MTSHVQCNHHLEKPFCCTPFPVLSFPSHHNLVASTKHSIMSNDCDKKFLRIIIHYTIVYLEGRLHISRLTRVLSIRDSSYLTWKPYFPTSCLQHCPCVWICIRYGICCMSNLIGRHLYLFDDMLVALAL